MTNSTVQIPKKVLNAILDAGARFVAAEDALEDFLLASDPRFVKKMRLLRQTHLRGGVRVWQKLKMKYGV